MKSILLSSMLCTCLLASAQFWNYAGPQGFTPGQVGSFSVACARYTTPSLSQDFIVGIEDATNGFKASVMRWPDQNLGWEYVGSPGISTGQEKNVTVAAVQDGPYYVAYADVDQQEKATVMQWNGTAWIAVGGAGFTPASVQNPQIALIGTTPYIAFRDMNHNGYGSVMKYDSGGWAYVGTPGFTTGIPDELHFTTNNGTPYLTYKDGSQNGKTTVMYYNGMVWQTLGPAGFTPGEADNATLSFYSPFLPPSTSYIPVVAFKDYTQSNRATVMRYENGSWTVIGMPGFSVGAANHINISGTAIAPESIYIVYSDAGNNSNLAVMQCAVTAQSLGSWDTTGVHSLAVNQPKVVSSIYNEPFIVFRDWNQGGKLTAHYYYATVSLPENPDLPDFIVYPNPTKDFLYVESPLSAPYIIIDAHGRIMASGDAEENKTCINISELSSGLYILITDQNGERVKSRFVKL